MIHFVGAGSGAPDLITVRGARLLEKADIVIYAGSLVNRELLEYAKPNAKIYDSAYMTLEEVLDVMTAGEKEGREIVRLHTGDPSIYGAVREQMDLLMERGIDFDMTPGVSSFCGAAAALKAEYTLPEVSQTVIITRRGGRTPVPERENLKALAVHGASMVIFLSTGMIDEVCRELCEGGYDENTPAAVVYKATWEDEMIIRGTLKDLAAKVKAANIKKTALITVGNFLGDKYAMSKLYDKEFETEFRKKKR